MQPGDLINWEIEGILQNVEPLRVRALVGGGAYLLVDGSNTGIPTSQAVLLHDAAERAIGEPGGSGQYAPGPSEDQRSAFGDQEEAPCDERLSTAEDNYFAVGAAEQIADQQTMSAPHIGTSAILEALSEAGGLKRAVCARFGISPQPLRRRFAADAQLRAA